MQEVVNTPSTRSIAFSFFSIMSLVIAAVLIYGFSFTIGENLIRPAYPRPWILYLHALVSASWIALFIAQASLVSVGRVDLHRRLGQWGLALGAAIPVLGVATAIAMAKVRLAHGDVDAAVSFPIPLNDSVGFAITFTLAALWRREREYHRRLMYVATCILTAPGFGRIPALDHAEWFYAGVDVLIAIGALRDALVFGKVHIVYRYTLPAVIAGQLLTAYFRWTPWWLANSERLFR